MRFSRAYIPTSKEIPNDAVLQSHILLTRAGYIKGVASGLYNFLPLGKKSLDKIRTIVKEELDHSGCQEVDLSFVTPAELWEESGRIAKFGKELLRFRDRKEALFVLGPTHEEMMVALVRHQLNSYKQLPQNLYQIKTKFRDEARPRFGLMRGREFVMKDGYSFHENENDMKREFYLMQETYKKIFNRLGLDFRVVEADSGAIGGSGSREFMVIANSGEDTLAICNSCDYGANIETAKRQPHRNQNNHDELNVEVEMDFAKFKTPNIKTIEELSKFFHISDWFIAKAVVKKAIYENSSKIAIFFVRGGDEVEEKKAINSINALELIDPTPEELLNVGLIAGFIGLLNLPKNPNIIKVIDLELQNAKPIITGANELDYHYIGVSLEELPEKTHFADLIRVKEGDICPICNKGSLIYKRGIEVGHIFQLGTKYSEPLGATFLDRDGKSQPMVMGTYGIGVSRLLSAIVEQSHDQNGIIMPLAIAPYKINILISNIKNSDELNFGEKLYSDLIAKNIEVILDDRNERFGFKIRDAELIGFPYTIIIGKGLINSKVELLNRKNNIKEEINSELILNKVLELVE